MRWICTSSSCPALNPATSTYPTRTLPISWRRTPPRPERAPLLPRCAFDLRGCAARVREQVRKCLRRVAQPRWAGAAIDDERGHGDRGPPFPRERLARHTFAQGLAVVRERVRHGLHPRPHGCHSHLRDHLRRHLDSFCHEVLDRVTPASAGYEPLEPAHVVRGDRRTAVVDDERRLVQSQLRDGRPLSGRVEHKGRSRGHGDDECRSTNFGDQCVEIFYLARGRVWWRVTALATAATVIRDDGEVGSEERRELSPRGIERPMRERTIHGDDRLPVARARERDGGAVFRMYSARDCDRHRHFSFVIGGMFWLSRKRLVGSYRVLIERSRSQVLPG